MQTWAEACGALTSAGSRATWCVLSRAVKAVQQLASALQDKAKRLSAAGERQWTAKEVELCLFASAAAGEGGGGPKPAAGSKGGGKRKSSGGEEAGAAGKAAGGSGSKRKR